MIEMKLTNSSEDLSDAFKIRERVFIKEQKVLPELEWDEMDKIATHFILYLNKIPIGTARVFEKDSAWYIGRMAVLKEYRGKGFGKHIMENVLNFLNSKKPSKIIIHAQTTVVNFYKKFGFVEVGDEFLDAGIKHREMVYFTVNKSKSY
jgi:predicted GNAT family N-acyltransferase